MAQENELKPRWKLFTQSLDALAGGMDFDPDEEHRRRFATFEDRLASMERQLRHGGPVRANAPLEF